MHPTHLYRNTVELMVFRIIRHLLTTIPCTCVGRPLAILIWEWQLHQQDMVIILDIICTVTPHLMAFMDLHHTIGFLIRPHEDPVLSDTRPWRHLK